jgi:hypothetical protein
MPSTGLGLYNRVVKATAKFGGNGFSAYVDEELVTCPLCLRPDVRLQGNKSMDQHVETGGFTTCPASGKALPQAARLRFDENYNLVGEDLFEEDSP